MQKTLQHEPMAFEGPSHQVATVWLCLMPQLLDAERQQLGEQGMAMAFDLAVSLVDGLERSGERIEIIEFYNARLGMNMNAERLSRQLEIDFQLACASQRCH